MIRSIALSLLAATLVAACGGDDDDASSTAFFDPAEADAVAHAALPAAGDLPGSGWDITGQDNFDAEDDSDFDELAAEEESCSHITDLVALGSLVGGDGDEDEFAGRARVEFERAAGPESFPTAVEVEVEIMQTVADAQGGWSIARSILESDDTSDCIGALMTAAIADEAAGLLEITLEATDPPADAPSNGAVLSFSLLMEVPGILEVEAILAMYFWPYANANVQVLVIGSTDDLDGDAVAAIVHAVDDSVRAAAD
jgi:hypothetical protein